MTWGGADGRADGCRRQRQPAAGSGGPWAVAALLLTAAVVAAPAPAWGAGAAVPELRPPPEVCAAPPAPVPEDGQAVAGAGDWPQGQFRYREVWRYSWGEGVTVAVVDSGVQADHPALVGRVSQGWDVTSGQVVPDDGTDCAGHGTQVAALIAGNPDRGVPGIAPGAQILPIRQSWGVDEQGQRRRGSVDHLIAALRAAVDAHARVINVSVTASGLTPEQQQALTEVVRDAADQRLLIVAAAGNHSENPSGPVWPAALAERFPNVVTVAGTAPDGTVDPDSITGPAVTVTAPGAQVPCPLLGGGATTCRGTSYAAPFVAGLAALLLAQDPDLTPADVVERITRTADSLPPPLPNPEIGFGAVNPLRAVSADLGGGQVLAGSTQVPFRPGPPAAQPTSRRDVLVLTVGAAFVSGVVALGAVLAPRGRRRGWRPAGGAS